MARANNKEERSSRRPPQKKSGILGMAVFGAIMGALLVGGYVGYKKYLAMKEEKRLKDLAAQQATVPKKPKTPTVPITPVTPVTPVAPITTPAPITPTAPKQTISASFRDLAKQAEQEYIKGNFGKAATLLDTALKTSPPPVSARQQFERYLSASQLFDETMRTTKPEAETIASNLYEFQLTHGGAPFLAKVLAQHSDSVKVRTNAGVTMTLKNSEILEKKKITQAVRDQQMRDELVQQELAAENGIDYFNLAIMALESNFAPDAVRYLQEAQKKDAQIATHVMDARAKRLFASAAWDKGRGLNASADRKFAMLYEKYPNSAAAKIARQAAAEEQQAIADARRARDNERQRLQAMSKAKQEAESRKLAEEARLARMADDKRRQEESAAAGETVTKPKRPPTRGSSSLPPEIEEANQLCAIAEADLANGETTTSRAKQNKYYKHAVKNLRIAVKIYNNYLANHKDRDIESRFENASRQLYWAKKMQVL